MIAVPIAVSQCLRFVPTPPPVEISNNVARRTWMLLDRSHKSFPVVWIGVHLAYGITCGMVYRLVRRFLPGSQAVAGLVFGLGVWAVSYLALVAALRLYPWPADVALPRQFVMISAHVLYGLTVAQSTRFLEIATRLAGEYARRHSHHHDAITLPPCDRLTTQWCEKGGEGWIGSTSYGSPA